MSRSLVREVAAKFLGTFVLIVFGVGVVAPVVLSGGAKGDFFTINCSWAVTVAMAVLRGFLSHAGTIQ